MPEARRNLPGAEIERQLLAALCSKQLDSQIRSTILAQLASHTFADPENETIFQALAKIPRATGAHIRETLSARLTRLGFPDIDVEPMFELPLPSPDKIQSLLQRLKGF